MVFFPQQYINCVVLYTICMYQAIVLHITPRHTHAFDFAKNIYEC